MAPGQWTDPSGDGEVEMLSNNNASSYDLSRPLRPQGFVQTFGPANGTDMPTDANRGQAQGAQGAASAQEHQGPRFDFENGGYLSPATLNENGFHAGNDFSSSDTWHTNSNGYVAQPTSANGPGSQIPAIAADGGSSHLLMHSDGPDPLLPPQPRRAPPAGLSSPFALNELPPVMSDEGQISNVPLAEAQATSSIPSHDHPLLWLAYCVCGAWRRTHPIQPSTSERAHLENFYELPSGLCDGLWVDLYSVTAQPANDGPLFQQQHLDTDYLCRLWKYSTWDRADPSQLQIESAMTLFRLSEDEILQRLARSSDCVTRPRVNEAKATYARNQGKCLIDRSDDSSEPRIPRFKDTSMPFVCTTCYQTFSDRTSWRRHEDHNWPQKMWVCRVPNCRRKNVFLRKELYQSHSNTYHQDADQAVKSPENALVTNFSDFDSCCVFRDCEEIFHSWQSRIEHLAREFQRRQWTRRDWKASGSEDENDDDDDDDDGNNDDSNDPEDDNAPDDGDRDHDHERRNGSGRKRRRRDGSPRGSGRKPRTHGAGNNQLSDYSYDNSNGNHYIELVRRKLDDLKTWQQAVSATSDLIRPYGAGPDPNVVRTVTKTDTTIVQQVRYSSANTYLARKIIHFPPVSKKLARQEATIMRELHHPHIVKHVSDYCYTNTLAITMEPFAEADLRRYMYTPRAGRYLAGNEWQWFSCLASALNYIHEMGIRHRDIKPSNILISNANVFIADFGLANLTSDDRSCNSDVGFFTRQYAAPEFGSSYRGRASDIWSLGFVFLELLTFLLGLEIKELYVPEKFHKDYLVCEPSYAANPDAVREWITSLKSFSNSHSTSYPKSQRLLAICQRMVASDYTCRPLASAVMRGLGFCDHYNERNPRVSKSLLAVPRSVSTSQLHITGTVPLMQSRLFLDSLPRPTCDMKGVCSLQIYGPTLMVEDQSKGGLDTLKFPSSTIIEISAAENDPPTNLRPKTDLRETLMLSDCKTLPDTSASCDSEQEKQPRLAYRVLNKRVKPVEREDHKGKKFWCCNCSKSFAPRKSMIEAHLEKIDGGKYAKALEKSPDNPSCQIEFWPDPDLVEASHGWAAFEEMETMWPDSLIEALPTIQLANINSRNRYGLTPLGSAFHPDRTAVILLPEKATEMQPKDISGRTPLHEAIAIGHEDIVRLLLDSGAEVGTKDYQGRTPLHEAVAIGHKDLIRLLLDNGAEVGTKDYQGRTPLHEAAAIGHKDLIRLLLDSGADIEPNEHKRSIHGCAERQEEPCTLLNEGTCVDSLSGNKEEAAKSASGNTVEMSRAYTAAKIGTGQHMLGEHSRIVASKPQPTSTDTVRQSGRASLEQRMAFREPPSEAHHSREAGRNTELPSSAHTRNGSTDSVGSADSYADDDSVFDTHPRRISRALTQLTDSSISSPPSSPRPRRSPFRIPLNKPGFWKKRTSPMQEEKLADRKTGTREHFQARDNNGTRVFQPRPSKFTGS